MASLAPVAPDRQALLLVWCEGAHVPDQVCQQCVWVGGWSGNVLLANLFRQAAGTWGMAVAQRSEEPVCCAFEGAQIFRLNVQTSCHTAAVQATGSMPA
jgi:hypothetical protein